MKKSGGGGSGRPPPLASSRFLTEQIQRFREPACRIQTRSRKICEKFGKGKTVNKTRHYSKTTGRLNAQGFAPTSPRDGQGRTAAACSRTISVGIKSASVPQDDFFLLLPGKSCVAGFDSAGTLENNLSIPSIQRRESLIELRWAKRKLPEPKTAFRTNKSYEIIDMS